MKTRKKPNTLNLAAFGHVQLAVGDAPEASRTLHATITVYNTPSTSQRVVFHDGSLTARGATIDRVKVLRDHNQGDPLGYLTAFDGHDQADLFIVDDEGGNGDRALAEAANGLRDGVSIGFRIHEYAFDDDNNLHVYRAEFYEVSLCAVPDFVDAGVSDVAVALAAHLSVKETTTHMDRAALDRALAAGTINQETYDQAIGQLDFEAATELAARAATRTPAQPTTPASGVPAELAAGPTTQPTQAPGRTEPRGVDLATAVRTISTAVRTGSMADVQLALVDILPASDAGHAFLGREDWIGEVFTARETTRPWIDSFGTPLPLNSVRTKGFRYTERAEITGKYAGNKEPFGPSKGPKTEEVPYTMQRWVGGWDIDRVFVDFADEAYLTAFWEQAADDYKLKSDVDVADQVLDLALANTAAYGTVLGAIAGIASRGRRIKGASINRYVLSGDLFDQYSELKTTDVPFWLANAIGGVDLNSGEINLQNIIVRDDPDVPEGTVVGYDTRAAKVREKGPIQVRAVDIAKGGVDMGFYSYGQFEAYDERLFLSATVAPAAGA